MNSIFPGNNTLKNRLQDLKNLKGNDSSESVTRTNIVVVGDSCFTYNDNVQTWDWNWKKQLLESLKERDNQDLSFDLPEVLKILENTVIIKQPVRRRFKSKSIQKC